MFETAKLIRIGIVTVGAFGAWFAYISSVKSGAVQKERATVERKSTENANKADAARRSVEAIPAAKLRDRYFRD